MVTTTTSSPRPVDESQYYYLPADQDSQDAEMQGFGWTEPIVIDDEDLMFGGKSLSAWYEEERKSVSYPAEEERRGRQRVRQQYSVPNNHHHHHHHHHHTHPRHQHHHHHHHHHNHDGTAPSATSHNEHKDH